MSSIFQTSFLIETLLFGVTNVLNQWKKNSKRPYIPCMYIYTQTKLCQGWSQFPIKHTDIDIIIISISFTHWGLNKMAHIWQKPFSNTFSWTIIFMSWSDFHSFLFLNISFTTNQHWLRNGLVPVIIWHQVNYLNQYWPSSLTYMCITRHQSVN